MPIGIAEFELQIKKYVECGGTAHKRGEAIQSPPIIREHLQDNFLWGAADLGPYIQCRDMIKAQAARTLLNRRRLPVHAVSEARPGSTQPSPSQDDEMPKLRSIISLAWR